MNLTQEEFAAEMAKMQGKGPWHFRSLGAAGLHISRGDDYVMRQGPQGLVMVRESKPEIHFKEHKFSTTNAETALFLRNHKTKFGGYGKQYIEITEFDETEPAPKGPRRPKVVVVKKWGSSKADALQALGSRSVPVAEMKRPTWNDIISLASEHGFILEGREPALDEGGKPKAPAKKG